MTVAELHSELKDIRKKLKNVRSRDEFDTLKKRIDMLEKIFP